ncbi:GNAT family N-acetyltransferase [Mangrovitalea sediminis]|uniref:GNAT family N-acetyltransferase n=1 Tax=Mangrovitalea sediminis TaxID=1982043 RepID=UPI000BE5777D|nr:GNAT family N-acetyltransferase [Mangrovitalea sediminis]
MSSLTLEWLDSLARIDADDWNALAGTDNPFVRHEFLLSLEESRCVSPQTGWTPHHLLLRNSDSDLVALAPTYLKTHSRGEYVFDWGWADAYDRYGVPYYPKLLTAVPFTPSTGPRLIIRPGYNAADIGRLIADALQDKALETGLSSWHILFPDQASFDALRDAGFSIRLGCQFHWHNEGFRDFDDFLGGMTARKRKCIRRERRSVDEQDIRFQTFEGADIDDTVLDAFYDFYCATYFKRGQPPYLNQEFFRLLRERMPEQLLLVMALKDNRYVAGALFLKNRDTLFGRYWGCLEEYNHLHFETCYYQGIDYCIRSGLSRFDAGAQGEHKIQRGFRPILTQSLHWIAHPDFRAAIDRFLEEETPEVESYRQAAEGLLPFRRGDEPQ